MIGERVSYIHLYLILFEGKLPELLMKVVLSCELPICIGTP